MIIVINCLTLPSKLHVSFCVKNLKSPVAFWPYMYKYKLVNSALLHKWRWAHFLKQSLFTHSEIKASMENVNKFPRRLLKLSRNKFHFSEPHQMTHIETWEVPLTQVQTGQFFRILLLKAIGQLFWSEALWKSWTINILPVVDSTLNSLSLEKQFNFCSRI